VETGCLAAFLQFAALPAHKALSAGAEAWIVIAHIQLLLTTSLSWTRQEHTTTTTTRWAVQRRRNRPPSRTDASHPQLLADDP
jgi:hypothetical protein